MATTKKDRIAVLMRTKNSGEVIQQTLKALFSQDFLDFELAVVDSGSEDNTLEIVREYPCKVISIKAEDYYPAKVLNDAIANIDADIIVFLNSDAVMLSSNTLSTLIAEFKDSKVQAAFGRQLARPYAQSWVKKDYQRSFPDKEQAAFWIHLSLPLAAMRKTIWEKRPFYSDAWGSEDTEWGYWAKKEGICVKYVSKALVMHSHNYTFKQLYGRRFIEGEADSYIYKSSFSFPRMLYRWVRSIFSDLILYIQERDYIHIPIIPFQRFVYHWAYYKGHRLGMNRQKIGSTEINIGQREVLKRL